jgi:hypothetical protein
LIGRKRVVDKTGSPNVETEIDNLKEKSIEYRKKIAGLEGRISTLKEFDSTDL